MLQTRTKGKESYILSSSKRPNILHSTTKWLNLRKYSGFNAIPENI